jgi:hypothetical protein
METIRFPTSSAYPIKLGSDTAAASTRSIWWYALNDPDWPDTVDRESGTFVYFGDNKRPGRALHETLRFGNELLRRIL